jgi:sugar lactone lactonase YvrE
MQKQMFILAITALIRLSTGQAQVVSTFAGSGLAGSTNGTGIAASFYFSQGVCADATDNIYVADYGNNRIRKITPTGVVSTFAGTGAFGSTDGLGSAASFNYPNGVCADASGNIYVADTDNHKIRKISPTGVVSTFAGTSGPAGSTDGIGTVAKFNEPKGICVDGSGNIYVADSKNNKIRKITLAGLVSTFAGTGGFGTINGIAIGATFNRPNGICVDASNNIYVVDGGNQKIRKITPAGIVSTFAGTGAMGSTDGIGTVAKFTNPTGICVDAFDNIYVADNYNQKIRKITPTGIVSTFAGTGAIGSINAIGAAASFNYPAGVCTDASGNIYITDSQNNIIRKITLTIPVASYSIPTGTICVGSPISFINASTGPTTSWSWSFPGATVSTYTIQNPIATYTNAGTYSITLVATNYLGSSLPFTQTITVNATPAPIVTINSGSICSGQSFTLVVGGASTYTYSGGSALVSPTVTSSYSVVGTSTLGCISSNIAVSTVTVTAPTVSVSTTNSLLYTGRTATLLAVSSATNYVWNTGGTTPSIVVSPTITTTYSVTVTDNIGCSILASIKQNVISDLSQAQLVSTFAGSGAADAIDSVGILASFSSPKGVCTDAFGNIYVADSYNNKIRKITPTGIVSTFAGSGAVDAIDGIGTAASFNYPIDICADATDNIYVADYYNNKIRKITPTGVVTTLAGSGTAGSTNGIGTTASFNLPEGVCTDALGNIYVGDTQNSKIRKITPSGIVSTFAGSGAFGSTDGIGTGASFRFPRGVCADALGNIYVADGANFKIRKITSSGVVSTFAGSGASGSAEGVGTSASFNVPIGVCSDAMGNIYVADNYNHKIRKITPSGVVSTFAGSGAFGSIDGTATGASFNFPTGVYADASGNIYVADGENKIRKIASVLIADFSISAVPKCVGSPISFMDVSSGTPTSWSWSFPGATVPTFTIQSPIVSYPTAGTYSVTLIVTNLLGSSTPYTQTITVNPAPLVTVNSGSICAGQSFTIISSGASTYSYSGGSYIVSPTATSSYSVVGTNSLGCAGTNTAVSNVLVNSTPSVTVLGTNSVCIGTSNSYTASGATSYTWNTGATTPSVSVSATVSASYSVIGVDALGCSNTSTINLIVDNTCADVWPGDANSDGIADNLDVLELGLHMGQTGVNRATTSNLWQSYFSNNWVGTITSGKNVNHSDCNGDGTINQSDTLAIFNNYGLTHAFKPSGPTVIDPQLNIISDQSFVEKGKWGTASVYLGDPVNPINNINGVAYTLNYDNSLIETDSVYLDYPISFINAGNQNLHFRKRNFTGGVLYTATTHTTNTNVSGNGKIATIHFKIKSSLAVDAPLNFSISQANSADASGAVVPLTVGTTSVLAVGASVGLITYDNLNRVTIYPNPTNGVLNIEVNSFNENMSVIIYNALGQPVLTDAFTTKTLKLNTSVLTNGFYFIDVMSNNKTLTRSKFVKE